jgi:hypothetical protein
VIVGVIIPFCIKEDLVIFPGDHGIEVPATPIPFIRMRMAILLSKNLK